MWALMLILLCLVGSVECSVGDCFTLLEKSKPSDQLAEFSL